MIKDKKFEIIQSIPQELKDAQLLDRLPEERLERVIDGVDDWLENRPWYLRLLLRRLKGALVELVKEIISRLLTELRG